MKEHPRKTGILPKKSLGQNFLIDKRAVWKMVEAAEISKSDTVVEVGAGLGAVTYDLVQKAGKVIAYEIDERLFTLLKDRFKNSKRVEIVNKDVLLASPEELPKGEYKLVGSLPYNISKRIIKKFLELDNPPSVLVVLIQKEVAQKYCAKPPKATFLSDYISLFGEAKIIDYVSKRAFWPVPEVDGIIVKVKVKSKKGKTGKSVRPIKVIRLIKFIKVGFGSPRKKLVNVLAAGLDEDKEEVKEAFEKIGVDKDVRAENLELEAWEELCNLLWTD